jgi:UDP-N-acetylmuramyl tripeptide synthase
MAGQLADRVILTSDNPRSENPAAILSEIEAGLVRSGRKDYEIVPDRRRPSPGPGNVGPATAS